MLKIETAENLVSFSWQIEEKISLGDEDLFLEIFKEGECILSRKVSFLSSTEEILPPGKYEVQLKTKTRQALQMFSSFHYTPKAILISENERRHHLILKDIDWEELRRDIELGEGLSWYRDIDVKLCIKRYPDPHTSFPLEEWISIGYKDYFLLLGALKAVEMHIVYKNQNKSIKNFLTLEILPPKDIKVLEKKHFLLPEKQGLFLTRQIVEPDVINLKAWWKLPKSFWEEVEKKFLFKKGLSWPEVEVRLYLYYRKPGHKKWKLFRPEEERAIGWAQDWIINQVPANNYYKASLVLFDRKNFLKGPEIISSPEIFIPPPKNKIVLMPIDEYRLFTYWHLEKEKWISQLGKFAAGKNLNFYLKIYEDFFGHLYHLIKHDICLDPFKTDHWYLHLKPNKAYRVQLIAVREDGKFLELTPVSNIAQTGALNFGNQPISYRTCSEPLDHPSIRPLDSRMNTAQHSIGYLILHLHAHLPYIRRRIVYGAAGIWQPLGFPEEWFHEALVDTYIPLIDIFEKLWEEGVDYKLSMDISPTLCNMMRDPLLQEEFLKYIEGLINLARAEIERVRREAPAFEEAAWMHLKRFEKAREIFLRYGKDLTKAFRRFQEWGKIEISTCAGTHAFLPFYTGFPLGIKAQIHAAIKDYEETFGRSPLGIWLPECAFVPGLEKYLREQGLRYFFSETHTILRGDSPAEFGVHAPIYIRGSEIAVFARDPETGKQVWSGEEGYPGDPDYLDFHIKGGPFRYCRVTNRHTLQKDAYRPAWARNKAAAHAQHFMESRNFRFEYIKGWFWKKPLSVATYDAELFGHHWFEGPLFLYFLFKKLYYDQNQTELITPSDYLSRHPTNQELMPPPSSWGDKGSFDKWMYGSVSWMYRHIHEALEALEDLGKQILRAPNPLGKRILKQALREVLWAMNSDVAFVISNGHFVDKMKEYFFESLERFWILYDMGEKVSHGKTINERLLKEFELTRPIFRSLLLEKLF